MSTYSVYNIKIDNQLSFTPGATAGHVLAIGADGNTYWTVGGGSDNSNLSNGYSATSSTTIVVPSPGYVVNFDTQDSLAYTSGQSVIMFTEDPEYYVVDDYTDDYGHIIGKVNHYDVITGSMSVVVDYSQSIGNTYSYWHINLTGDYLSIVAGATGGNGSSGTSGKSGGNAVATSIWNFTTTHHPPSGNACFDPSGLYISSNDTNSASFGPYMSSVSLPVIVQIVQVESPNNFALLQFTNRTYENTGPGVYKFDGYSLLAGTVSFFSYPYSSFSIPGGEKLFISFQAASGSSGTSGISGSSGTSGKSGSSGTSGSAGTSGTSPSTDLTLSGNLVVNGQSTFTEVTEVINSTPVGATASTVTYDFSSGNIWYHGTASQNYTANFINVPTTNWRTITTTVVIAQGGTAYIPTSVKVNGTASTVKWAGGTASGSSNKVDIIGFSFIYTNSGIPTQVLGQINSFS